VTENYANPEAVFDNYAYPRGGAVLHMLRKALGEENWWRAINHYLTKYAHQPVSTDQFRIAIEEATGQSMDWFFDEWLYKMGHPVFRVTQSYDAASKSLTLKIKQEQKPDPDSSYPQATFFQTPVEIEIGTTSGVRVERVTIDAKEEQSFSFPVDAEPLLVNFDYGDTLIKELHFDKTTDALLYELTRDDDVMGRMWALGQLSDRRKDASTAAAEKERIANALAASLREDKFWGMRFETAAALQGVPGDSVRAALLAATKDQNPRVRTRAVQALGASKDATLASVYQQMLNDQSYGVIRAAAQALGETKDASAYDALAKLLDTTSWRDNIRIAGLNGLTGLGDKRSFETALKFSASSNPVQLRSAAIPLLAAVGKDDPRAFPIISGALLKSAAPLNFGLLLASGRALVELGDQRGVAVFDQAVEKVSNPGVKPFLMQLEGQLKQKAPPATPKTPGH